MSKTFSKDDVASHKTPQDLYIIVDDDVYDMTTFQSEHPGGQKSTYNSVHFTICLLKGEISSATSRWERCLEAVLEISQ